MSDVIQGAKSRNYEKSDIPGIQNSGDTLEYVTVQEVPGRRGALDAVIHGQTIVSTGKIVESGSVKRFIKSTAHGAEKGWIMRPSSGASQGQEISIVKIIDVDNFVISTEFPLAISDTFDLCRFVTPKYTADGDLFVSVSPSPISYNRKSGGVTTATPVLEDLDTPANSRSLPVVIHSIDGAPINITAGDLNVQLSDTGANPDITRIGNGTNRLDINANKEALTHDQDAINLLTTIDSDTSALRDTITTEGGTQPANALVVGGHTGAGVVRHVRVDTNGRLQVDINSSALPTGASTSALQTTGNTSLSSIDTKLTSQATAANQTAQSTLFGAVTETAPATDTASSGLNGRLQRIAQRITSLIALFPTALGQGTMATSFKVVLASDQSAIPVTMAAVPTGGSTAALQTTGNTSLGNIDTDIGAPADAVATTDTGTFSLISLTKRIAQNITGMSAKLPTALGSQLSAASLSVTLASNQTAIPVARNYVSGTPKAAQITVGTSQVRATTDAAAPSATRQLLKIKPSRNNTGAIFLIPTGGTISTGMEIVGPDRLEFEYDPTDYYLISDTVGQIVEIFEVE